MFRLTHVPLLGLLLLPLASPVSSAPAPIALAAATADQPATFLVDGKPCFIKGITYGGPPKGGSLDEDLATIASLGANTIRNWGCDDVETPKLLDAAQRHGLKVVLGLWLRHGRAGAEGIDSFNYVTDTAGIEKQYNDSMRHVRAYHQHPALLCWGAGNEVTLNIATDAEKEAYARFLERVVQGIKKIDTVHPVASMSAWSTDWTWWQKFTPSLDIYAINTYGYGAAAVPGEVQRLGVTKPWMITEFGASGEWEAKPDANGVKVEPDDAHKVAIIKPGFRDLIESKAKDGCLGGFVFHFGNGFDHTSLWLSLRVDGYLRPQYWATREAFTGKPADNATPVIDFLAIRKSADGYQTGQWVEIGVSYVDKENAACEVSFAGNLRDLPWPDKDEVVRLESKPGSAAGRYLVKMPARAGAWKLYALVADPAKNLGAATTSIVLR
ncbi:MAG: glycoside hydrolase family 2 TIM barrel-domain containing protein [Rariglobus sp.]|nr:glycoside hydrolase family 2 TIM barrel-domain containing protein [Rariglobus sp.]